MYIWNTNDLAAAHTLNIVLTISFKKPYQIFHIETGRFSYFHLMIHMILCNEVFVS